MGSHRDALKAECRRSDNRDACRLPSNSDTWSRARLAGKPSRVARKTWFPC